MHVSRDRILTTQVCFAKLEALAQGAALASQRLW